MARLLENQAKELLRESSSMSAGDVQGFAAVAFPLVRRVFGNLIANELVSVQPMSLPSGLIFFLDFTFNETRLNQTADRSLYGGNVVGSQITGGVQLDGANGTDAQGPYNLDNGYASPTGSMGTVSIIASGTLTGGGSAADAAGLAIADANTVLRFDPDLTSGSSWAISNEDPTGWTNTQFNYDNLAAIEATAVSGQDVTLVRRLTQLSRSLIGDADDTTSSTAIRLVWVTTGSAELCGTSADAATLSFPIDDDYIAGGAVGSVVGDDTWGLEESAEIPEINLKVDSVSVTAMTKKLKAKWTPELGQDLNAYHNLDAEVELTSLLSEQIALEIDREILEDLVKGATGAVYYWARSPGLFVDKATGVEVGASALAPDFTGTVSEWYETLGETINDVSAQIHRKTLRGGANFLVTSPEVANILEFTAGFRANVTVDDAKGTAGTQQVGTLSKRYDVYVDPYFPRNLVLVGRKGNSFLESGYVYAPYVPLQVTPTIFGVEDFVPRKGVMTRYAKKMVRPDMYGVVVVRGLLGESGG